MKVETFERRSDHIGSPSQSLDIVSQRSSHNLVHTVYGMLQVQRRVVVGFRNIREQRSQAQPVIVIIDTYPSQRYRNLIGIRRCSRSEVFNTRMLGDISKVSGKPELLCQFVCSCGTQCIVKPIIRDRRRSNLHTARTCRAYIIIGKTADKVTVGIFYRQVFTTQRLIFQTCPVIQIKVICYVPIVGEIYCKFVFVSFIIF